MDELPEAPGRTTFKYLFFLASSRWSRSSPSDLGTSPARPSLHALGLATPRLSWSSIFFEFSPGLPYTDLAFMSGEEHPVDPITALVDIGFRRSSEHPLSILAL
ncbi:hypothetical protein MSAN_01114000 [Mycena sanguinolenta]|uniref:Uncharacterized protein n=1 Tax=Mycena sanguinolenta TaxID=230812 RepID=A0A8H6YMB0_9AGAR|nr:hypothetical protein MSAN_01114000 [Mycena sanguinolenta]